MSNTTKRAMAESLKKLLAKKSLDKVTVGDIVEDCGVNRQTFYYHFHDIFDLVEWIFDEEAGQIVGEVVTKDDWREQFLQMFNYLTDNAQLVLNVFHSKGWEYISSYIQARMRPPLEYLARQIAEGMDVSEDDFKFVVDVYLSMVEGLFNTWLGNDMKDEYIWDVNRFLELLDGSIEHALGKFDRRGRPG